MAGTKDTALRLERYVHSDYYHGMREQITAAGVAADGMFPGDTGRSKTSVTFKGPPALQIQRKSQRRFVVRISVSDDEYTRRRENADAARALVEAQTKAEDEIRELPASRASYHRLLIHRFRSCVALFQVLSDGAGYAAVDTESRRDIDWALGEAQRAVERAGIVFNADQRAVRISKIKARVAGADASFQGFLATTAARTPALAGKS